MSDDVGGNVDPDLTALTSTAATTVVQLLTTATWEHAKTAVSGLWRRVHPERADTVEAELAESRTAVIAARRTGDAQAEKALVNEWSGRLGRLITTDPQLADELRHVVAQLRPLLADAAQQNSTITMQATASGSSLVNQAGRDLYGTGG